MNYDKEKFKRQLKAYWCEQRARIRQEPYWLHDTDDFNHNLILPSEYSSTVEQLFEKLEIAGRRLDEKKLNLEVIIANLIQNSRHPTKISYNRKNWNPKYHRATYSTLEILKSMKENGLIEMAKGYKSNDPKKPARRTRIWATQELLDSCPELTPPIIWKPKSLIEVRDNNKNLIDFNPTEETNRVERILKLANEVNSQADIRYSNYKLSTNLIAIYVRKPTLYGRLHTKGYSHYQGLYNKDKERLDITINGNPIVELDYSALHPYMLYANEGIQYEGDPYLAIEKDRRYRKLYKRAFLSMMNSSKEYSAEGVINLFIIDHWKEMQKLGISKARPIMDAIKKAHGPIKHYFCSGNEVGLRIMNKDAKIALNVVRTFTRKGISILGVHDSFLVEQQHEDLLFETMAKAYKTNMKGYTINIDKEFREISN